MSRRADLEGGADRDSDRSAACAGDRCFERIEGLLEAVSASGVERSPAERRYAQRQRSLRDGITVSDRDWATLQELLV